jgi:hypothetical protein
MVGTIVFPLLLATLGLVIGICIRLSIAVGQLKLVGQLAPLKTYERYAYYVLTTILCVIFYFNAPVLFVQFYGLPESVQVLGLWLEVSVCFCLCVSSFLGIKATDKVLTSKDYA